MEPGDRDTHLRDWGVLPPSKTQVSVRHGGLENDLVSKGLQSPDERAFQPLVDRSKQDSVCGTGLTIWIANFVITILAFREPSAAGSPT